MGFQLGLLRINGELGWVVCAVVTGQPIAGGVQRPIPAGGHRSAARRFTVSGAFGIARRFPRPRITPGAVPIEILVS